jgi:hypothetical protein
MNADDRAGKLRAEISRRIVDGGDDVPQIVKDVGAPLAVGFECYPLPEMTED